MPAPQPSRRGNCDRGSEHRDGSAQRRGEAGKLWLNGGRRQAGGGCDDRRQGGDH